MAPLPGALGGTELVAWRLDRKLHGATWDSGEGAFLGGGRWNSKGVRAVYCALDPSTTIMEVAVHAGFKILNTVPYVLSEMAIPDPGNVLVVRPEDVPNPHWLTPIPPGPDQQQFGDALLAANKFVVLPSAVSMGSWNLIFLASNTKGLYDLRSQNRFALDTRLRA